MIMTFTRFANKYTQYSLNACARYCFCFIFLILSNFFGRRVRRHKTFSNAIFVRVVWYATFIRRVLPTAVFVTHNYKLSNNLIRCAHISTIVIHIGFFLFFRLVLSKIIIFSIWKNRIYDTAIKICSAMFFDQLLHQLTVC